MAETDKVFHIRHSMYNDEGVVPSPDPHPSMSPDIICYQNSILTYKAAVDSYPDYICKHFIQNYVNLVYIRAKNRTGVAQKGEAKCYYSPFSLLHVPANWQPLYTASGALVVELSKFPDEIVEPDEIALCSEAFALKQLTGAVNKHYCMMAITRKKNEDWLKLPEKFNGDWDLWAFLRLHANIAYNNLVVEDGFMNQYTELIQVGNHNTYDEEYAVRLTLGKGETFGSGNLGRIQLLSTEINAPFDLNIYPEKDANVAISPLFKLPAGYNKQIIATYFAADPKKKVVCTIVHDYITRNSKNLIPVSNDSRKILKTVSHQSGEEIFVNEDAKIGDCTLAFIDSSELDKNFLKNR